ncbi:MAG TPA: SIS domain-containing protein [Gammaproteobacteria bacterium]|nr:SIS domain-containing protein [Gammaproteobacteria bacterium]
MLETVKTRIRESISVKQHLLDDDEVIQRIADVADSIKHSLRSGGKVIFAGNGGSFADSIHLAAEFVSRFQKDRPALAAVALGANNSILTAVGNDYGYDRVFARELEGLAKAEDVFIAISTSGNSTNIIRAVECAKQMNIRTWCLTGAGGGELCDLAQCVCIPADNTARVQEGHILVGHIICELVEDARTAERD